MHDGIVGFASQGIYLAAHLLCDEAQFSALLLLMVQRFEEIGTVRTQANFLLIDVHFFQVENQFLFEPVLIDLGL